MKKGLIIVAAVLMLAATLAACGSAEVELSNKLETSDRHFAFSVPEDWDYYDGQQEEALVLQMTNGDGAFSKVYFYDNTVYDYPYDVCLEDITKYYGDNIIGDVEDGQVGGLDASRFEYNMVDFDENNEEADYHGYEYVIDTPYGTMEVDIFYSQDKTMGKIFKPSDTELDLLRSIVQSLEVSEQA